MKTSLRGLIGYLTTICIILAIFRRPLCFCLEKIIETQNWLLILNDFFLPWYIDFYLLGFENWWPLSGTIWNAAELEKQNSTGFFGFVSFFIGTIIYVVSHLIVLIYVSFKLGEIFWPATHCEEDEEYEEKIQDELLKEYNFGGEVDD